MTVVGVLDPDVRVPEPCQQEDGLKGRTLPLATRDLDHPAREDEISPGEKELGRKRVDPVENREPVE